MSGTGGSGSPRSGRLGSGGGGRPPDLPPGIGLGPSPRAPLPPNPYDLVERRDRGRQRRQRTPPGDRFLGPPPPHMHGQPDWRVPPPGPPPPEAWGLRPPFPGPGPPPPMPAAALHSFGQLPPPGWDAQQPYGAHPAAAAWMQQQAAAAAAGFPHGYGQPGAYGQQHGSYSSLQEQQPPLPLEAGEVAALPRPASGAEEGEIKPPQPGAHLELVAQRLAALAPTAAKQAAAQEEEEAPPLPQGPPPALPSASPSAAAAAAPANGVQQGEAPAQQPASRPGSAQSKPTALKANTAIAKNMLLRAPKLAVAKKKDAAPSQQPEPATAKQQAEAQAQAHEAADSKPAAAPASKQPAAAPAEGEQQQQHPAAAAVSKPSDAAAGVTTELPAAQQQQAQQEQAQQQPEETAEPELTREQLAAAVAADAAAAAAKQQQQAAAQAAAAAAAAAAPPPAVAEVSKAAGVEVGQQAAGPAAQPAASQQAAPWAQQVVQSAPAAPAPSMAAQQGPSMVEVAQQQAAAIAEAAQQAQQKGLAAQLAAAAAEAARRAGQPAAQQQQQQQSQQQPQAAAAPAAPASDAGTPRKQQGQQGQQGQHAKQEKDRGRSRSRSHSRSRSYSEGELTSSRSRSRSYSSRSRSRSRSRERRHSRSRSRDRRRRSRSRSRNRRPADRWHAERRPTERDGRRFDDRLDRRERERWERQRERRRDRGWDPRDSRPPGREDRRDAFRAARPRPGPARPSRSPDRAERAKRRSRSPPTQHAAPEGKRLRREAAVGGSASPRAAVCGEAGPQQGGKSRQPSWVRDLGSSEEPGEMQAPVPPPPPHLPEQQHGAEAPLPPGPPPPQPQSPRIDDKLRALASRFEVDWDAADFDQLVRLGTQLSNSVNCFINRERPGLFEEQRALLDGLAHQLHIAPYGITSKGPPFSGEQWSWRLPGDQLTQPERVIPWSPPAAAAAAAVPANEEAQQQQQQQVAAAAPPDPRRQPEVAAELAAARTWFGGGRDEQPPAFALPPAADGTPLSWSQEPHFKEGQPEVSSAAAAAAAAAAAEERAPGDGDDLYAPAAPRHDDAFHRSIGGTLSSLGRRLSAGSGLAAGEPEAPAAMDIEEGYWQALHPDLKGQTRPQQLDYLQQQMRAGKLEQGWPIFREADGLYIYLEDAPPALADLAWPKVHPTQEAERFVQLAAQALSAPPAAPAAEQRQQQQQGAAGPAAQGEHRQHLEAEAAALRALQQRAGSLALSSSAAVLGNAPVRHERQCALAHRTARAEASRDDAALDDLSRWLKRSTDPEFGHAGVVQAAYAAQQRALGAEPPAPLPRTHGPPPPQHLGAAVRHVLLRRQDAEQVMRKMLHDVTVRLLKEKQGGSGSRADRERRRSTSSAEHGRRDSRRR